MSENPDLTSKQQLPSIERLLTERPKWGFMSNHTHVLVCLHLDPEMRLSEISYRVGLTLRIVQKIIKELSEEGVIMIEKIAGAIEGVLWNLPAMAFSKCVPGHLFDQIRDSKGQTDPDFTASLKAAAAHAARMALETLLDADTHKGSVINVNFPPETSVTTAIVETFPAKLQLGGLFAETRPGKYAFRYTDGTEIEPHPESDRAVLASGRISRSILDFSRIGKRD